MTKTEFCEKWKRGWREMHFDGQEAYFFTAEQMMNDLNLVVYSEVMGWKNFVDRQVEISVDLDEWQRMEAEAIEKRKN